MKELGYILVNTVRNLDLAVSSIIDKHKYNMGLVIAFAGIVSTELSSYCMQIALGKFNFDIFVGSISSIIYNTLIFYTSYIIITYAICKIFKGKGKFLEFSRVIGWVFLPLIIVGLLFDLYALIYYLMVTYPSIALIMKAIILIVVYGVIYQIYLSTRIAVRLLKEVMGMSKKRAIIVFWISVVPLFIIFDVIF